jgi:hypothetical protein
MNAVAFEPHCRALQKVLLFPILAKTGICHPHGRPQIANHLVQLAAEAPHGVARKASWICSGLAPSARAADRVSAAAAQHIAADASWHFVSRQSPILAGEPPAVGQGRRFQITVSTAIDNLGVAIVMGPFAAETHGLFALEAGLL